MQNGTSASLGGIPHPVNPPIYNDIMWITLFCALVIYLVWSHRKRSTLSNTALMAIGSWSMFWQEFVSNWGGYLLYSPDLNLMPWGPTWWTGPNKPWFLLFSYPVFMTFIYSILVWLIGRIHRAVPSVNLLLLTLIIAGPLFWLNNFIIDGSSVDAGIWTYVDVIGPYIKTSSGGLEPLIWPMIPFGIYGALMVFALLKVDANGVPKVYNILHPERFTPGVKRETLRALTAIIVWNALFFFLLTLPVNLYRQFFGGPSLLVP